MKRKRSPTDETNSYSPVSRYDCSPPKRLEQPQHMADRALHVLGNVERATPTDYPHPSNGGHRHEHHHSWDGHTPVQQSNYAANGTRHDASDTHLAEALQRATHDNSHPNSGWGSRDGEQDDEDRRGSYSQEHTPQGTGGLKRKRNFSNRTKTGCMTCRRRKKKCDEQHPKCRLYNFGPQSRFMLTPMK
jgi:Fungal Zn(2)-Cys(6) binuclear cluster domain